MFTFIVPVKLDINRLHTYELWIERALELGLSVVLIFDGQDTTLIPNKKLHMLRRTYKNFSYYSVNFGSPGEARNYGLSKVITTWVAFVDSDDNILVDNYLNLIEKCQREEKSIGIGYFEIKVSSPHLADVQRKSLSFISRVKFPGIWRYVFQTDRLRNQRFCDSKYGEDIAFLASLQIQRKELCIGDELLYEYNRSSPGQLTQSLQDNHQLVISLRATIKDQTKLLPKSIFTLALNLKILGQLGKSMLLNREKSTELVLAGGLGNQLFQIAGALSVCKPSPIYLYRQLGKTSDIHGENISQILNWDGFRESTQNRNILKTKYISLALRLSGMRFSKWHEYILRSFLEISGLFLFWRRVYINRLPDDSKLRNRILIGYFQDTHEDRMISSLGFHKYLNQPKLMEIGRVPKGIFDAKSLVIHVRGGDYANENAIGLLGPDYFESAITKCLSLTKIESYFIFTNDLEMCKKVIPTEILKVATIYSAGETTALQSLLAMSHAKNIILSNSTFSWWSAYLGERTINNVIYPEPWFKSSRLTQTRARNGWVPIKHDFLN
jgi:hypothetical protein